MVRGYHELGMEVERVGLICVAQVCEFWGESLSNRGRNP